MIKTVILDGTEQRVTDLGGSNTVIANFGSAALYASAKPDIVPDGKNVAAISAGSAVNLPDTNGTVYLLGTGRIQLEGTDYGTVNVGMLSSASSGGDTPKPQIQTMPVMDGIRSMYTKQSRVKNVLIDEIGFDPVIFSGDVEASEIGVKINADISGKVTFANNDKYLRTIYAVIKAAAESTCACLITRATTVSSMGYGLNILSKGSANGGIFISSMGYDLLAPNSNDPLEYAVVAMSADYSKNTLKGYINGTQLLKDGNGAPTIPCYKDYYKGHFLINDEDISKKPDESVGCDIAFLAFGFETHSDEQLLQNSEWLMKKYLGGDL